MSRFDNQKASVVLLSGFLGAGKTTLLKSILSWESDLSDTVVVVNEFGEVGIDGALLKGAGTDVVELTSGCICCTLSADLIQSLERDPCALHPAPDPDRVDRGGRSDGGDGGFEGTGAGRQE